MSNGLFMFFMFIILAGTCIENIKQSNQAEAEAVEEARLSDSTKVWVQGRNQIYIDITIKQNELIDKFPKAKEAKANDTSLTALMLKTN